MKTQPTSDQDLNGNESQYSATGGQGNQPSKAEPSSGSIDYHNYVPRHFNHGRTNIRGIGSDHEPGTLR